MSYQNVDVYVLTRDTQQPVSGVLVRVFSPDGSVIFTESETDEAGHVGFTLWSQTYSLRFYRFQARFRQPQVIVVSEGVGGTPAQNQFNVYAEMMALPIANDPYLCRASGTFRDITGAPHRNLTIIFIGEFAPILLQGSGVLSERRAIRTDDKGFACVDLIRCARYAATVEGYEDHVRKICVPDAPSVSLPALLFSMVDSVYFDPPSPWTLSVGSTLSLTPTVFTNSQIPTLGPDGANVIWKAADPTVVSVTLLKRSLVLRGLKVGNTQLLASRRDLSIIPIPFQPELLGSGQSVFVQ
jgi:hypothetical protein